MNSTKTRSSLDDTALREHLLVTAKERIEATAQRLLDDPQVRESLGRPVNPAIDIRPPKRRGAA